MGSRSFIKSRWEYLIDRCDDFRHGAFATLLAEARVSSGNNTGVPVVTFFPNLQIHMARPHAARAGDNVFRCEGHGRIAVRSRAHGVLHEGSPFGTFCRRGGENSLSR